VSVLDADAVVVGGGPAGAALATTLAPTHRVVLVDRGSQRREGLGETLPGAAARLLRELGVWDAFVAQGHPACHARLSRWGGPQLLAQDALRDLDGPGWSLDRAAFDGLLRTAARGRGTTVLPGRASVLGHDQGGWRLGIADGGRPHEHEVRARVLVDASGRGSTLLRLVGPQRTVADRLVCAWTHLPLRHPAQGTSYVESAADGWWFTAPVPGGRRVVAFHTDPALVDVTDLRNTLSDRAAGSGSLAVQLRDSHLEGGTTVQVCAAGSSRLGTVAGADWLAVGDAAMAFDPLSSQGLFHALYTGLTSAARVSRRLAGDLAAMAEVQRSVEPVWSAYRDTARHVYGSERRWAESPFWQARQHRLALVS
jgi:flavin-dependent dehydrogenase